MKYSVVLMTEFPAAGQGRKARGRVSSEGSGAACGVCAPAPRTFPGLSASPRLGDGLPLQRGARLPAGNRVRSVSQCRGAALQRRIPAVLVPVCPRCGTEAGRRLWAACRLLLFLRSGDLLLSALCPARFWQQAQNTVLLCVLTLWCYRGDSPPAELILFKDFISGIMTLARDERGEHTRGSQAKREAQTQLQWWQHKEGREFLVTQPGTRKKPSPHKVNRAPCKAPLMCSKVRTANTSLPGVQDGSSPALPRTRQTGCGRSKHKHRPCFPLHPSSTAPSSQC